jgi:shikimate kinase
MRRVDRPIFLIGFMASGKTAAGRLLAARLGLEIIDVDEQVERLERRSIERIFATEGEDYFREREWEALRAAGGGPACVVATGGGAFLGATARRWMKRTGLTVWLDVSLEEARRRVPAGDGRPLWREGKPLALRILYERRRAAYALAHVRVDASRGDPEAVAERIQARSAPFFR